MELVAALLLPQADLRPATQATRREISGAVNIRDRLVHSAGRAVGAYASSIDEWSSL